jgi:hypothetical protein
MRIQLRIGLSTSRDVSGGTAQLSEAGCTPVANLLVSPKNDKMPQDFDCAVLMLATSSGVVANRSATPNPKQAHTLNKTTLRTLDTPTIVQRIVHPKTHNPEIPQMGTLEFIQT